MITTVKPITVTTEIDPPEQLKKMLELTTINVGKEGKPGPPGDLPEVTDLTAHYILSKT